ncbi:MAG: hypothetical protein J7605_05660 [Variovorax sp.]|nr:hypothetical protein [Variovorax sp.]
MTHRHWEALISGVALAAGAAAFGQQDLDAAMARYERVIAACNSGNLPRPERDACIRDAGQALDRVRRGQSTATDITTPDGRATVILPQTAPLPRSDSDMITSPDGDSTIVLPADGSRPLSQ